MRISFVIHYADGNIFKGTNFADWQSTPDEGILVVTEFYDRCYGHPPKQCGKRHAGLDYYWMDEDGEIIGAGPADHVPVGVWTKRGREVDSKTWDYIYNFACIDPEYL